ncbi:hypothetical protein BH23PLA1_BH23PLA1_27790 [soil metagenome]
MATARNSSFDRLRQRLGEAGTVETLRPLLREIEALELARQDQEALNDLREQVFEGLHRLTIDRPGVARAVLLDDLLPLCLRPLEEWPGRSMRWRYDEILREWLDAFPGSTRLSLRGAVLGVVVEAMAGPRWKAACATAGAIAYRTEELVEALGTIVSSRDNEDGDFALRSRVHLGVPVDDRVAILAELHRRAGLRWNHSLVASLRELADPGSLDIIFQHLGGGEGSPGDERLEPYLAEIAVQIPAAVAERHAQDDALQDQVWARLMALGTDGPVGRALSMNSQLAGGVDSPEVIPTYLGLIDADPAGRRDIVYYRLEDLVRPRQLLGWDQEPGDTALAVLRDDARGGTAMESNWVTRELRRKLITWETLLSLGRTDVLSLLGPAVEVETNGFVIGEVCEIAACLAIDPLPPCVPDLIAATYTRIPDTDDQRLIAQIGAVHVAHSARSEQAFRTLVEFGMFKEGGVLISLIDALADCAAAMIASGRLDAGGILWRSTRRDQPSHRRIAAAAALARLLRRRLLRLDCASELIDLIRDDSLDIFARREILDAAGFVGQGSPDPALVETLRMIATEAHPTDAPAEDAIWPALGPVALAALARLGVLSSDDELLGRALGLARGREGWSFPSGPKDPSSAAFATGLMYVGDPETFAPAMVSLIQADDWVTFSRLIPHLRRVHHATPTAVIEALVERAHRMQTDRTAEPELFPLLAYLAPDRLVREPWGDPSAWTPQVRSAFADAVATARPPTPELLRILPPLLGDGQYGVRRAAYRAMASVGAESLATLCESWAVTDEDEGKDALELRQRAAEAAGWLPDRLRSPVVEALATDSEPSVRQAFARCDRERRERAWARTYVDRLVKVEEECDLLSAWRYGRALGQVGDDDALDRLEQRRQDPELPPALRHWLTRVIKKVRKRWDEVTRRWPEPWFARRGRLEEVVGVVIQADGTERAFRGWLWQVIKSDPTAISSWGGWSEQDGLATGKATLKVDDRRPAEIVVTLVNHPSGTTYFSGNRHYPSPVQ